MFNACCEMTSHIWNSLMKLWSVSVPAELTASFLMLEDKLEWYLSALKCWTQSYPKKSARHQTLLSQDIYVKIQPAFWHPEPRPSSLWTDCFRCWKQTRAPYPSPDLLEICSPSNTIMPAVKTEALLLGLQQWNWICLERLERLQFQTSVKMI